MIKMVRCPQRYADDNPAVFLGGGIADCPDWQRDVPGLIIDELAGRSRLNITLYNPRRLHWYFTPGTEQESAASAAQVAWEHRYLERADVVMFWFPESVSPQPIALYELGAAVFRGKRVVVGASPSYVRCEDVHMQLSHARPGLRVISSLEETVAALVRELGGIEK